MGVSRARDGVNGERQGGRGSGFVNREIKIARCDISMSLLILARYGSVEVQALPRGYALIDNRSTTTVFLWPEFRSRRPPPHLQVPHG